MSQSELVEEILNADDSPYTPTAIPNRDTELFRVELDTRVIQQLLDRVQFVVSTKDTKLTNVQCHVMPFKIQLYATNLDLSLVVSSQEVEVVTPGKALLPAKRLLDVVRNASGVITLSANTEKAHVEAGHVFWDLRLQPGVEYPSLPDVSGLRLFEVNRELLLRGLHSVRYAAARDASRSAPSLMMVNIANGKVTACDGGRFQQFDLGPDFPLSLNIPVSALDDLLRILKWGEEETVEVGEVIRHLVFKTPHGVFLVSKLASRFPDMEKTLLRPSLTNNRELKVDRRALISAIRHVRVNADPDTSALVLSLSVNTMIVSARDRVGNEAQEVIDVDWMGGEYNLTVNHHYLLEMLQMSDSEVCKFKLGLDSSTRRAPILLQDENSIGVTPQMNNDWVRVLQR